MNLNEYSVVLQKNEINFFIVKIISFLLFFILFGSFFCDDILIFINSLLFF